MNVVLGVCGSIAAYRAADLARDLMRAGCTVRVCLTDAGQKFVTPHLFEGLTGNPCLIDTFDEPVSGRMAHIDWARQADLILIAPATANTLNKIANGVGDDMLTTLVLASTCPLVLAPAMNPQMYLHDTTQASMATLRSRAALIVEPLEGDVACGEHGQGKLATNHEIVDAVLGILRRSSCLKGKKIVITSGPTAEDIDDVRFLTNRSSGKMGNALAKAAHLMGGDVTVISGPTPAIYPIGVTVIRVRSAKQMLDAALVAANGADLVVGAAAVADYRPATMTTGKLRRSSEPMTLALVPNEDVIAQVALKYPAAVVVGFAAEPTSELSIAREKLVRKNLYAIAMNDVSQPGIGFDANENELTLITRDGLTTASGRRSKLECSFWLLEEISQRVF